MKLMKQLEEKESEKAVTLNGIPEIKPENKAGSQAFCHKQ